MRRLRWKMDAGGFWEMDLETPSTMEGTARPGAARQRCGEGESGGSDGPALIFPLGLSRGSKLSRSKQLDFMHRFMASPLVASFSGSRNCGSGISVHHADILHVRDNWSATIMEQFHLQKFVSRVKNLESEKVGSFSWIKNLGSAALDVLHLGFGTEIFFTPDSSLFIESYGDGREGKGYRNKAVFTQNLPGHDLVMEAASPRRYVSGEGNYWDVPLSLGVDFSSTSPSSDVGYHLCLQHNSGKPKSFSKTPTGKLPPSLLPGFSAKAAIAIKRNLDVWRKRDGKKKMLQPFDVFQCDPHLTVSGIFGSAVCGFMGENSLGICKDGQFSHFRPPSLSFGRSSLSGDSFLGVSCQGQIGHFQKMFLDLTRVQARVDCPSVANLLRGSFHLVSDWYKSCGCNPNAIHAICPDLTISFQQQIVGPISFRVESRIVVDLMKNQGQLMRNEEHIFALEYAMQVLGSARATAWYSPKRQEAMVELRFFEN